MGTLEVPPKNTHNFAIKIQIINVNLSLFNQLPNCLLTTHYGFSIEQLILLIIIVCVKVSSDDNWNFDF